MREQLQALIGGWIEPTVPTAEVVATEERPTYLLEKLRIDLGTRSVAFTSGSVPALFTRPRRRGPFPALLYVHAHGRRFDIGKRELVDGRGSLQLPSYAGVLADLGIAVLCIDLPTFGERQAPDEMTLAKSLLWHGDTLLGLMLRELAGAVDYLHARDDIIAGRIGVMGMSMGSTLAWWLAALDTRIAAVAELCCFADVATLVARGDHNRHGIYMTVPGLLRHFDTWEIASLIVPRPHLCCVGLRDPLTPPEALRAATEPLAERYRAAGAPDAWQLIADPETGHEETAQMRAAVTAFLQEHLVAESSHT